MRTAEESNQASSAGVEARAADGRAAGSAPGGGAKALAWLWLLPILAVALGLRLWDLARPFIGDLSWNEVSYVIIARGFDRYGPLSQYTYGSSNGSPLKPVFGPSPLLPWMVYVASKALGAAEWVARLPMLALGVCAVVVLYLIARELYGDGVGLLAAFAAGVMPGVVFYSRTVHLDGPMTTFGLAAFLALLLFERKRRYRWLVASAAFLGLAMLAKYTSVLFFPSLAWLWLRMVRNGSSRGERRAWALPLCYFVAAAIPAGIWLIASQQGSSSLGVKGPPQYLIRSHEWSLREWYLALQATWLTLTNQVGHALWYPLVLVGALSAPAGRLWSFARQHLGVVLLIVPWFAQLIYPQSWRANQYYVYPALYGLAIVLALVARDLASAARPALAPKSRGRSAGLALVGVLVCLSSLADYKEYFHASYYPWYVVTREDPFSSARLVRAQNVSNRPVLADLPHTLYYAESEYGHGRVFWWGSGDRQTIAAVESGEFDYVVFTYVPTVDVLEAIERSRYRRIGPAAWEKARS